MSRTASSRNTPSNLLASSRGKKIWTPEEDALLKKLVENLTTANWTVVAQSLPERTGKQCRERWHNHLSDGIKKGEWTEEEDRIIVTMQKTIGNQWAKITKMLPGRTDNAVKNRFHATERAKLRKGDEGVLILSPQDQMMEAKIMAAFESSVSRENKNGNCGSVRDLCMGNAQSLGIKTEFAGYGQFQSFDNDADDDCDEDGDDDYLDTEESTPAYTESSTTPPTAVPVHNAFSAPVAGQFSQGAPMQGQRSAAMDEELYEDLMEIDILSFDEDEDFTELPAMPLSNERSFEVDPRCFDWCSGRVNSAMDSARQQASNLCGMEAWGMQQGAAQFNSPQAPQYNDQGLRSMHQQQQHQQQYAAGYPNHHSNLQHAAAPQQFYQESFPANPRGSTSYFGSFASATTFFCSR